VRSVLSGWENVTPELTSIKVLKNESDENDEKNEEKEITHTLSIITNDNYISLFFYWDGHQVFSFYLDMIK